MGIIQTIVYHVAIVEEKHKHVGRNIISGQ
jgi:hypothetical protein